MNPAASRATASPSQSVCGRAPMKTKAAAAGTRSCAPATSSVSSSRWPSPEAAVTRARVLTSTFAREWIRSTR